MSEKFKVGEIVIRRWSMRKYRVLGLTDTHVWVRLLEDEGAEPDPEGGSILTLGAIQKLPPRGPKVGDKIRKKDDKNFVREILMAHRTARGAVHYVWETPYGSVCASHASEWELVDE